MRYPQARLLVFSKAPVPGQVKTRLIPLLGAEPAARLYAELLEATLVTAHAAGLCPLDLWCAPDTRHAVFQRARARHALALHQQPHGDLGARMSQALHDTLQTARHALLIGADCPALAGTDLATALQDLQDGADVVLGPASDGGYYLIGMSGHHPQLFMDIPWGTRQVLGLTQSRCRAHGLRWTCLPEHADLDTPEDYRAYRAAHERAGAATPETRKNNCDY